MSDIYDILKDDYQKLGIYGDLIYDLDSDGIDYQYDDSVEVYTGASKLVIPIGDKVYKTGITKMVAPHWNDEVNQYDDEDDEGEPSCDYCAFELQMYEEAVAAGVGKAFVPIKYFDEVEGLKVYEAQKADEFRYMELVDEDTRSTIRSSRLSSGATVWVWAVFLEYYGLEFCKKLSEFCDNNSINDLSENNCGMIDERPVFIDYSGYYEN